MPLGSSSAAPVTIPGPIFERTRKTFGHHESNARGPNFGESLRIARLRSGILAMEDYLTKAVLRRTRLILRKRTISRSDFGHLHKLERQPSKGLCSTRGAPAVCEEEVQHREVRTV
jgi:hypothetical protein